MLETFRKEKQKHYRLYFLGFQKPLAYKYGSQMPLAHQGALHALFSILSPSLGSVYMGHRRQGQG